MVFAGGGTGGHLYPALAIADEIKKLKPDVEFLFVGTNNKIEARIVPMRGLKFKAIWISGLHRRVTMENLLFPVKVLVAFVQSFFLVQKFRPDAVVGTGGYVCGPVLFAASLLGIPTFVHESNSFPGITTKLLAGRASRVFIAFEATSRWLKRKDNIELVGTPTRSELSSATRDEAASYFGLDARKHTVLIFGGSLGAASINNAVLNNLDEILNGGNQIIWQTGEKDFDRIKSQTPVRAGLWLGAYIDRMELAYAAADVVVGRSGATTIAELTRLGKPAVFIPYPHASEDHQTKNARNVVHAGAALMISDNEASTRLMSCLSPLLTDQRLRERMSAASKQLGKADAGTTIAQKILSTIEQQTD